MQEVGGRCLAVRAEEVKRGPAEVCRLLAPDRQEGLGVADKAVSSSRRRRKRSPALQERCGLLRLQNLPVDCLRLR
jgi:hypothetical protein